MRLLENQAKQTLQQYGITLPKATTVPANDFLATTLEQFDTTVAIKPLANHPVNYVLVQTHEFFDVENIITKVTTINPSLTTRNFYVEEAITVPSHIQLKVRTDYVSGKLLFQAVNHTESHGILVGEKRINAFLGMRAYHVLDIASDIDLPRGSWQNFARLLKMIFLCYTENDFTDLKIARLGITEENTFVVLDAAVEVDPYALFRQPQYQLPPVPDAYLHTQEIDYQYHDAPLTIITNGTGLSLQVIDDLHSIQADAALPNIIEIGNHDVDERLKQALKVASGYPHATVTLVALFNRSSESPDVATPVRTMPQSHTVVFYGLGLSSSQPQYDDHLPNLLVTHRLQDAVQTAVNLLDDKNCTTAL